MTGSTDVMARTGALARAVCVAVLLTGFVPSGLACDSDADCGAGGTCIKREKRARGVCYGRAAEESAPPSASPPATTTAPGPVSGERRERAIGWLGDPEARIRDALPNAELGDVCVVTSDCPAGWECVVAGFEGRCLKP